MKKLDEIHEIMKYRDEDMFVELSTSFRTFRAQLLFTVRAQSTKVTFWRVESESGVARVEIISLLPLPDFYCLSRTVLVGAADGLQPDEFRQSAFLTGLSSS